MGSLISSLSEVDLTGFYDRMNYKFWDFFENKDRINVSVGGAGSSKSYSAFQRTVYRMLAQPGHNFLICRKVGTTNRISTFSQIQQVISHHGFDSIFKVNKSELSITCKINGNMAVFKGLDDIEKIKSITFPNGILTDILVEEASEITQKDFDQLNTRLRGVSDIPFQITLLLNPISDQHWIKVQFFDVRSYQKKQSTFILHSTFLDNEFIDEDYRDVLEGYKDIDFEHYRVYCLGEWGHYGNLIFRNYQVMKCPYSEDEFDWKGNGMDFGFNHPSVILKVGMKDDVIYPYNEIAKTEMTNEEFIALNEEFGILKKGEYCRADSAEPGRIKKWVQCGYNIVGADKGDQSVRMGIDYVKSHNVIIDPSCVRLVEEMQGYSWKKNKKGEIIHPEKPIDIMDDSIKSLFYALEPLSLNKGKPGVLSGTLSDKKKALIEAKSTERKKLREAIIKKRKEKREQYEKLSKLDKTRLLNQ